MKGCRHILIYSIIALSLFFCSTISFSQNVTEVIDFKASGTIRLVKLSWITSSEKNLKEFNVYRSIDQKNYYVIGNTAAKNKDYDSYYEVTDRSMSGGINYYKLESVDNEDKRTTLKYTAIEFPDESKSMNIITDVDNGKMKLASAERIYTIDLEFTDQLDRSFPVAYVVDSTHEITIITGPIMPGIYFLKCYLNKERYVRKKVVFFMPQF